MAIKKTSTSKNGTTKAQLAAGLKMPSGYAASSPVSASSPSSAGNNTKTGKVTSNLQMPTSAPQEPGTETYSAGGQTYNRPAVSPAMSTGSPDVSPIVKPTRYTKPETTTEPNAYNGNPILEKPQLQTIDENKIRNETRKRMQSSIDAINANYSSLIKTEQQQGVDRAGQTRAMNARSGLMGSDFGATNQEKTTQYNKQQEQALVDAKNVQVAGVLQNIEDRATAEIQNRKQEALGKYQMDTASFEKLQASARADFQSLAQSGVDLATLNPAQKAALFKQAGYDAGMGELIYNAMKPKPKQIDYQTVNVGGGRVLFYGVDPQTGELKQQIVNAGIPDEFTLTIAPDGTPIAFNKNTGESQILGGQGQFADPLDRAYKQAQIDKIYQDIANGSGDELLSVEEATKLGVPFGTTKVGAVGIMPGSQEKIAAAESSMTFVDQILRLTKELESHKGLDGATGTNRLLTAIPGSNARDFVAKFDELKGVLSLDNIKYLKGTGAISDAEQKLLADAASSLRRDTGQDAVVAELRRLSETANQTRQKLQTIINVGAQSNFQEFESQYGGSEGTNPKANYNSAKSYFSAVGNGRVVTGSKYHTGNQVDIDGKIGDPIPAYESGRVIAIKDSGSTGYGKHVIVENSRGERIIYGHLSGFNVKAGQTVPSGYSIGKMGNTGNVVALNGGDGSHLHIEKTDKNGRVIALDSHHSHA